jgi:hypothetical protein
VPQRPGRLEIRAVLLKLAAVRSEAARCPLGRSRRAGVSPMRISASYPQAPKLPGVVIGIPGSTSSRRVVNLSSRIEKKDCAFAPAGGAK